jgi:molybdopterin-guanine dinucleotide biosynthesis protein A
MTGVVLAGGQSRRFGRNKALEEWNGERLLDLAIRGLKPRCQSVLVVANDLLPYVPTEATLVRDILPGQGPLGGIFTALFFSPTPWVFVKATDMPFLIPEVVERMAKLARGVDAVVPVKDGFYEPLFALYHIRCLPLIAQLLERNEKQIVRFYAKAKVAILEQEQWRPLDPGGLNFKNINTPDEFRQIQ